MRLTFWTVPLGDEENLGTVPRAYKTNLFFLSDCNRWTLVNTQRVQTAIKRIPRGPVYHWSQTTGWNFPILNMCECFLSTREKGQSQGWQDSLQVVMWEIQHVKSAQQAPRMEKSQCSRVHSWTKRQTFALANWNWWKTISFHPNTCVLLCWERVTYHRLTVPAFLLWCGAAGGLRR